MALLQTVQANEIVVASDGLGPRPSAGRLASVFAMQPCGKARPQRVPLLPREVARAHAPSQQPHGTPSHRVQTDRETGSKTACSPMSLDHHGHRADLGRILLSHRLPRRLDLLSHPPSSHPFNCGTPAAWALLALSRSLSASKLTYRLT
ncbi:hypothetical protein BDA96_01G494600 [Sorghum bicolor]|uniref:Uncharacterized protein n=2 Tax=Sorghum bicolor TaxID=4558 RepID=A0A1Z5SAV9_SORBI|nr:hypothetical protein BDA96_01G494600 [Sorghum bicolor]OQU93036.1 hypothetical protein SORBI_3001G463650 [Sorghum bicolor]OQU93037.1 hypothetical protein SORBI_3001G463650 [Sorghum bicolor]